MKPKLLFLTPYIPAPSGHGSSMRCNAILETLAAEFSIYLLLFALSRERIYNSEISTVAPFCEQIAVYHKSQLCYPELMRKAVGHYADIPFDVIHVFKLALAALSVYLTPFAKSPRPSLCLDLDDYESRTRDCFAILAELQGDANRATAERAAASQLRAIERVNVPRYDRVYLSNERDRLVVAQSIASPWQEVVTVPNVVRLPQQRVPHKKRFEDAVTLLFVGTMDYYPNVDAMCWFCHAILPTLRSSCANSKVKLIIAGARPTASVKALAWDSDVVVTGELPDLTECYEHADIVVAPLRAGGGSRIKLLEAFSYRKAVVSTSIGADGLDVVHQRELLLADTAQNFGECCLRLIDDPQLCHEVANVAFIWLKETHTVDWLKASGILASTAMDRTYLSRSRGTSSGSGSPQEWSEAIGASQ
jgi:glycosyltransferase involved in cell wall biosynthesis